MFIHTPSTSTSTLYFSPRMMGTVQVQGMQGTSVIRIDDVSKIAVVEPVESQHFPLPSFETMHAVTNC